MRRRSARSAVPFGTDALVKSRYPTLKGWAILESSLRDAGKILVAAFDLRVGNPRCTRSGTGERALARSAKEIVLLQPQSLRAKHCEQNAVGFIPRVPTPALI